MKYEVKKGRRRDKMDFFKKEAQKERERLKEKENKEEYRRDVTEGWRDYLVNEKKSCCDTP